MKQHDPFFSVVIPTYNRAAFIPKLVRSILRQTDYDFEIIIVDDGSTDNTEDVVKTLKHDQLRYFRKVNGERGAARNFGARHTRGAFINFVDSDDVIYENHLQVARNFLKTMKDVEIFHLGYDIKDESGKILRNPQDIQSINRQILGGNILSANGVFVRRDVILNNPFNEDRQLSSLEDWELWIRMSSRFQFLHDNTVTSTIIQHDNRSVMTTDNEKIKEKVKAFIKYLLQDQVNQSSYGSALNQAVASANTYAALHLALAKESKREVIRFLSRGINSYPGEIFKRRSAIILIKLLGL